MISLIYILVITFLIIVRMYQKKVKQAKENMIHQTRCSHEQQINTIVNNHERLNTLLDNIGSKNKNRVKVSDEKIS